MTYHKNIYKSVRPDRVFKTEKGELIRVKYTYRRLILQNKIRLCQKAATKLVGPDCLYQLYSSYVPDKSTSDK